MMDAIEITIPGLPAYSISPNSRSHWRVKHRESQELKQIAHLVGRSRLDPWTEDGVLGSVNLHWTIYLGKRRKMMDRDNATATLKPAMDGLVSSGMIQNDTQDIVRAITVDQVKWAEHQGEPKIVVRIEPAG